MCCVVCSSAISMCVTVTCQYSLSVPTEALHVKMSHLWSASSHHPFFFFLFHSTHNQSFTLPNATNVTTITSCTASIDWGYQSGLRYGAPSFYLFYLLLLVHGSRNVKLICVKRMVPEGVMMWSAELLLSCKICIVDSR